MVSSLFRRLFLSFLVPLLLVVAPAAPVLAQELTPKQAWAALRSAAEDAGLVFAARGVVDQGAAMVVEGVRIARQSDPSAMQVTMDSLRIEPRGTHVALIPSERIAVTLQPTPFATRSFEIVHDGEIVYSITDTVADVLLRFGRFDLALTSALRRGQPTGEAFTLSLSEFDAQFGATRDGLLDVTMTAQALGYTFDSGHEGRPADRQTGESRIEAFALALSATEVDMLSDEPGALARAVEAGFLARLTMTTGATMGRSVQGGAFTVASQAGSSDFGLSVIEGQLELSTSAAQGSISGSMGPMGGEATFDGLSLSLALPLVATPDDRVVRYAMSFDGVRPSEQALAMLGASDFAGEAVSAAIDISADMRLTEEFGPDWGQGDEPPFELSTLRLDQFLLRVGDAELTGAGSFALLDGLAANIGRDVPEGTGDFLFDLIGGDRLLTRLSAAGLIPQDQQFFARMMMNGLGRPVGEDHLRSEVAIRPGGLVSVNGAPLPF